MSIHLGTGRGEMGESGGVVLDGRMVASEGSPVATEGRLGSSLLCTGSGGFSVSSS